MLLQNKNKKTSSRKLPIAILILLIIVAAVLVGYNHFHNKNDASGSVQSASTKLENKLDKEKTDQKGSSDGTTKTSSTKQSTGDSAAGSGSGQSSGSNVTPVITFFGKSGGQVEVDAFVPGILENGTCTLTITNGAVTVTKVSQSARANAQSTSCENFFVDGTGASSSWHAVVSYNSSAHNGTSQSVALQN